MFEDIPKHFVCRHFSYDVAQVEDALAEVLRYKVAGQIGGETFLCAADGFEGMGEGFVVADVCYDDVALADVGQTGGVSQN